MNRRNFFIAASIGFTIGYIAKGLNSHSNKKFSPEKVLNYVKETFQKQGPINGTWIYVKPERIKKNGLIYHVYHGGFSRNIDGHLQQYHYYADIETKAIIHVEKNET